MSKIYVASSWKNARLDEVVEALRKDGHDVYDFREHAFSWHEAMDQAGFVQLTLRDPAAQMEKEANLALSAKEWTQTCATSIAKEGFNRDFKALREAEKLILVLPAGRSAHLEAGFACGYAEVHVYQPELERPDLMVKMCEASGGKVWGELRDLRLAIFPGNSADRQRERAARLVEESGVGEPDALARLAARIREK